VSIKPPSDIVLDVARAADPASSAAAAERLARIAGDGKADPDFSSVMAEVETASPMPGGADAAATGRTGAAPAAVPLIEPRFASAEPAVASADAGEKAYKGLESILLQSVVSTMLPEDSEYFGEGSAGAIWRSMLAEQLGDTLAKRMDLNIMPKYLRGAQSQAPKHEAAPTPEVATAPDLIREMTPRGTS
jgi:peptidoglycan hydrolase FlgJ